MLEVRNLCKSYQDFKLKDVTFNIPNGKILGLVGENGAGKSTTIKLILGLLHKESGDISIFGENVINIDKLKENIGVVMDDVGIPQCLTIKQIENVMKHTFKTWNTQRFNELVKKFSLPDKKEFKDFSRGMKMKTGIAIALSHDSKLLILDEATSGLDPVIRDEVLDIFREYVSNGENSILISSHIVSDLEKLCDTIAFIHKGEILLHENKDNITKNLGIIHYDDEDIHKIPDECIKYKRKTLSGYEAIIDTNIACPCNIKIKPVSIEDLFIFMVKDGKETQ